MHPNHTPQATPCAHPNPILTNAGKFCLVCGHLLDAAATPAPTPNAVAPTSQPIAAPTIHNDHHQTHGVATEPINTSPVKISVKKDGDEDKKEEPKKTLMHHGKAPIEKASLKVKVTTE